MIGATARRAMGRHIREVAMISSVIPVLKLRWLAAAVLQRPSANFVVRVVLAWTLTAIGDPAAAQFEAPQQQPRVAAAVPHRGSAPRGHDPSYLDRPQSYTPVRSVPFNYGAELFPSLRQIWPKF